MEFIKAVKEQELMCYDYSILQSQRLMSLKDYKGAAIHLENATRSLNELQRIKNTEQANHQINLMLKQIEGGIHYKELLGGRLYGGR